MLSQNCARVAGRMLEMAGVTVHNQITLGELASFLLPSMTSLPRIHALFEKIFIFSQHISEKTYLPSIEEVATIVGKAISISTFPLRLPVRLLINLIFVALGARKGTIVQENIYEEPSSQGLKGRVAMMSSIKDLFRIQKLHHHGPIVAWQDDQETTCYYRYKKPSMNVLPGRRGVPARARRIFARYGAHARSEKRKAILASRRMALIKAIWH